MSLLIIVEKHLTPDDYNFLISIRFKIDVQIYSKKVYILLKHTIGPTNKASSYKINLFKLALTLHIECNQNVGLFFGWVASVSASSVFLFSKVVVSCEKNVFF